MIRRFNYTDRLRLSSNEIQILVWEHEDRPSTFDFGFTPPDQLAGNSSATVWVEAYSGPLQMRFPYGHPRHLQKPPSTALSRFRPGEKVLFRVKVVDESDPFRRILAWADQVRPVTPEEQAAGRRSILPVERAPLGDRVWWLDWRENTPVLQVNESITEPRNITQMARMDPEFISLVYPAVVRQILHTLVLTEEVLPVDDDDGHDWIRLAETQLHAGPLPADTGPRSENIERREWVERAVNGFCSVWSARDKYREMKLEEANA